MSIPPTIVIRIAIALTLWPLVGPVGASAHGAGGPGVRGGASPRSGQDRAAISARVAHGLGSQPQRPNAPAVRTATEPPAQGQQANDGGFTQIASHGFGDPANGYAWSMAWFNGKLYVGTSRNNLCGTAFRRDPWTRRVTGCQDYPNLDMRAQIWAYTPKTRSWQMVYRSPMVNDTINGRVERLARDQGYRSMAVYTDRNGVTALYVGTTGFGDLAYLLRSVDGVHFTTLRPRGLDAYATSIRAITPYAGRLFIAPISSPGFVLGAARNKVLVSDNPASGRWTIASSTGLGDSRNVQLYSMTVFNGQLYAAISNPFGYEVWRTDAQGRPPYRWTVVVVQGAYRGHFNTTVTDMAVFHNKLYVGSATPARVRGGGLAQACELIAINPDDSWDLIVGDARATPEGFKAPLGHLGSGFGDPYNIYVWRLASHDGWLYAGTYDDSVFKLGLASPPASIRRTAGFDLWKTRDGTNWVRVTLTGFGDPYNYGVRGMEDTPVGLFLGTANPFANAPNHRGGAEIWLLPYSNGLTQPHGVVLNPSPCPMAHCGPHIDGIENASIPTASATRAWLFRQARVGFSAGLGCSVGTHIAVCTGTNLGPNTPATAYQSVYVHALDFQGRALWDSRHLLNSSVAAGVPLLDDEDNSYVSDNRSIVSFSSEGVVRWKVPNPAHSALVSLNILASGFLVGQSDHGPLLVVNPQTGAIAGSIDLTDTVNGYPGDWATANTVSVVGNRAYSVTQFQPFSKFGTDPSHHARLYAVDVDAKGQPHVAWYWSFQGPTGGSPLTVPGPHTTIYDDGTGLTPGSPQDVMLFAVEDMGSRPVLRWAVDLSRTFGIPYAASTPSPGIQIAPAHDPRGGVWVWSNLDARVFRFNEATGEVIEALNIPKLSGDPGASPDSTIQIATNGGNPVMFIGVRGGIRRYDQVAAIDLATHSLLWMLPVGIGAIGGTYGQFPLVSTTDGNTILLASIFAGVVYGIALH